MVLQKRPRRSVASVEPCSTEWLGPSSQHVPCPPALCEGRAVVAEAAEGQCVELQGAVLQWRRQVRGIEQMWQARGTARRWWRVPCQRHSGCSRMHAALHVASEKATRGAQRHRQGQCRVPAPCTWQDVSGEARPPSCAPLEPCKLPQHSSQPVPLLLQAVLISCGPS